MSRKWRVFKKKNLPPHMNVWVVWDEHGEYAFRTGIEALSFVDCELRKRALARIVQRRRDHFN